MNSAILYLFRKKFKNSLKQLIKSPGKLIYLIAILVLFATSFLGSEIIDDGRTYRDIKELYSIIFAFMTMILLLSANS